MLYPFEKYQKHELGYWLKSYSQNGGTIDRTHTLIDLSGSDFNGEAYALETWFAELKKSSGARDFCGNSNGGVVQCATANSNFDNTMLHRHAHKEVQPDVLSALVAMDTAGAPDQVINSMLRNCLKSVFDEHSEGFKRIWAVINEKYDPLFNVDVEDIEKHTGSDTDTHTGTDTTTKSGNDALAHTGTNALAHSGTNALAHTGTNALAKSGTVAVAHTGTDTDTHSGTDTVTNDGDDSKTTTGNIENAKSGTETTADNTNSGTTTDNSTFVFDSVTAIPESKSEVDLHTDKSLTFSNRKDTQTYNNLKEQTDYNSTHETEYDTTTARDYNSTETTTNNTSDTTTFNDTETTTFNNTETTTFNNTETTTYNSGNEIEYDTEAKTTYNSTITRTKKGNQGVTMSQDMLEREIESWSNIDFLKYVVDTVARDLVLW